MGFPCTVYLLLLVGVTINKKRKMAKDKSKTGKGKRFVRPTDVGKYGLNSRAAVENFFNKREARLSMQKAHRRERLASETTEQ